jgi:hypothetical protein
MASQAKWYPHWTQTLNILRDRGDEPNFAKTWKAPSLGNILHQKIK